MPFSSTAKAADRSVLAAKRLAPVLLVQAVLMSWPAVAQTTGKLDLESFPEPSVFREIQLRTMACGRENAAEPCQQARKLADPLMDHPKLPASCKDSLWSIIEKATVAPNNTYARREALNRDATDVTMRCKPASKPLGNGTPNKPDEKKSGGLGGFLKGLGIGGGQSN